MTCITHDDLAYALGGCCRAEGGRGAAVHALIVVITAAALLALAALIRYAGTGPRKPRRRVRDEPTDSESPETQAP